jgi:hypothetical protein
LKRKNSKSKQNLIARNFGTIRRRLTNKKPAKIVLPPKNTHTHTRNRRSSSKDGEKKI